MNWEVVYLILFFFSFPHVAPIVLDACFYTSCTHPRLALCTNFKNNDINFYGSLCLALENCVLLVFHERVSAQEWRTGQCRFQLCSRACMKSKRVFPFATGSAGSQMLVSSRVGGGECEHWHLSFFGWYNPKSGACAWYGQPLHFQVILTVKTMYFLPFKCSAVHDAVFVV